ncbi:MAG: hypothetical protein KAW47_10795 [Thermoplasmatales archaeon]|nr:hypothetical protein [Thermoplasmatales archaeon]
MKKFIKLAIIIVIMVMFVGTAYAIGPGPSCESTNSSINNNYLNLGSGGIQQSEALINSHLQPMSTPMTITPDYSGPVFKDHKFQKEILNFLLREEGLKPFVIKKKKGYFEIKSSKSSSTQLTNKEYEEQKRVYVSKDEIDLKKLKKYKMVGYVDAYSKGKATLMGCFNQAVVDTGRMGGNILLILKINFMAGIKSSTIGLGSSGAAGFMHGNSEAQVYGAAIGYASSKATPQTNPYLHGIILFSEELTQ